jgi:hypothetical protein
MRIRPNSAGVPPSQCCSNVTSNTSSSPVVANESSFTSNWPVSVLQPRPSPTTSIPGVPGGRNGARTAPVYEPMASGWPGGVAMLTYQWA